MLMMRLKTVARMMLMMLGVDAVYGKSDAHDAARGCGRRENEAQSCS